MTANVSRSVVLAMQERVRLVNGEFAIESIPKRGTTVRVEIPLPSTDRVRSRPRATSAHHF